MEGSLREGILTISGGPNFERQKGIHTKAHGLRRTRNFFYLLRSESKQIMDLIRFIFACFVIFANTIYSYNSIHIRFKIFAQIRIQILDLMQNKFIFSYWRIFVSKYKFWSEYSPILKRISHSSEYSFENIRFFKYSLLFASNIFFEAKKIKYLRHKT